MNEHLTVRTVVEDGVATIVLDRPPRNLLDTATAAALRDAFTAVNDDDSADVVVFRGGKDAFCGGTDLERLRAGEDPVAFARIVVDLLKLLPRLTKPVVGAVTGDALMGGFGLACACDVVVAVEGARLGTVEASMGLWPMIAQVPAIRRLPPRLALENVITGIPWSAKRALELGIVNAVVPASDIDDEVARWAELVRVADSAIAVGRPLFYELTERSYDEGLEQALTAFAGMFAP